MTERPPHLRAVTEGTELPTSPYADMIRAIAEEAIAAGATTFLAIWEAGEFTPGWNTAPRSAALALGLMEVARAEMKNEDEPE